MPLTKITTNSLKEQGVRYNNLQPEVVTTFYSTTGGTVNGNLSALGILFTDSVNISNNITVIFAKTSGAATTPIACDSTLSIYIDGQEYLIPLVIPGNNYLTYNNEQILFTYKQLTYNP
jgi:hypothetical protein